MRPKFISAFILAAALALSVQCAYFHDGSSSADASTFSEDPAIGLPADDMELTIEGSEIDVACADHPMLLMVTESYGGKTQMNCGCAFGNLRDGLAAIKIRGGPAKKDLDPFAVCNDNYAKIRVPADRSSEVVIECEGGSRHAYPEGSFYRFILK